MTGRELTAVLSNLRRAALTRRLPRLHPPSLLPDDACAYCLPDCAVFCNCFRSASTRFCLAARAAVFTPTRHPSRRPPADAAEDANDLFWQPFYQCNVVVHNTTDSRYALVITDYDFDELEGVSWRTERKHKDATTMPRGVARHRHAIRAHYSQSRERDNDTVFFLPSLLRRPTSHSIYTRDKIRDTGYWLDARTGRLLRPHNPDA